jgi:hypothetical protein
MNNTPLNPGSGGNTIATEDLSGVHHQLIKMEFGGAGAATMVSAADPMPVNPGEVSGNIVKVGGQAVAVNSGNKDNGTQRVILATDQPHVPVTPKPAATGGLTMHRLVSAANNNPTSVTAAATQLYWGYAVNTSAAWAYLHLFDKASAPTIGTDTPVLTIGLPAGGGGKPFPDMIGLAFALGLAYAITTTKDASSGAGAAGDVILNLGYKS